MCIESAISFTYKYTHTKTNKSNKTHTHSPCKINITNNKVNIMCKNLTKNDILNYFTYFWDVFTRVWQIEILIFYNTFPLRIIKIFYHLKKYNKYEYSLYCE